MANQAYVSLSAAEGFRKRPIDSHGKLRSIYNKFVVATAGDIGSTFALGELPPGAVRVIYPLSFVSSTAGGVGLLLDIGWAAYRYKQDAAALNDGIEAVSVNGLANDFSVAAAGRNPLSATLMKFDFYSLAGVQLIATTVGLETPVAFTMETLITYLYE